MDDLYAVRELRDDTPDEAAKAAALRALRAKIDAPGPVPTRSRRRIAAWRDAGGRLAPSAGLAVAALLAVALWPGGDGDGGRLAPATAVAALERAATAAHAAPDVLLGPGDYFYVRERTAYETIGADAPGGSWRAVVPAERETWTNRDAAGRFIERSAGEPRFRSPRDRDNWRAAGSPPLSGPPGASVNRFDDRRFGAGGSLLTYEQLADLPSDGEAMYRRLIELARDAGPSPDGEAFVIIGDLLRSVPVPAHVRAGLYRAAGHIKGVRYAGEVTDELGRRGLAIDQVDGPVRHRIVFDPDTSQVLMEDTLTGQATGDHTPERLVLDQGVVPSETARP